MNMAVSMGAKEGEQWEDSLVGRHPYTLSISPHPLTDA